MKKMLLHATVFAAALAAIPAAAREISSKEAECAAAAWVRRDRTPLGTAIASADVAESRTTLDADGTPLFHAVKMAGGGVVVTAAESGVTPVIAFLDGGDLPDADGNPLWKILKADMERRLARVADVRGAAGGTQFIASAGGTRSLASKSDGGRSLSRADGCGRASSSAASEPFAVNEAAWARLLAEGASEGGVRQKASAIPDASGVSDLRVPALLATEWAQADGAANYYTPPYAVGAPTNYPCGCVALAGAQIANFWRFPSESRPQFDRLCWLRDEPQTYRTMGGLYDWADMPPDFWSRAPSDGQCRAVGKLCYDFGVATQMNWGPEETGGSGTTSGMLADAFTSVFGYTNAMAYVYFGGTAMPDALVERTVLANLDAGCPVVLSLSAHTVVADGYGYTSGALYTHLNLGWSGIADAWYNLPDVNVYEPDYGFTYDSSVLDGVVYNIFPTHSGELLTGRVLDSNGIPVSGAPVIATNGVETVRGTTNERGIYALRVEGGRSWSVRASSSSGENGVVTVDVGTSVSAIVERNSQGASVWPWECGEIGNSWGNDITLGAGAPVDGFLFVDAAGGSDANDGRTWATSKASIQAAVDASSSGDTIFVADGRYEPFSTANRAIEIRAVNGPETTFIDGSLQWARGTTNRCATLGSSPGQTNTVLVGLCLTNGVAEYGGGVYGGTLTSCLVAGNSAAKGGGGAYGGVLRLCTVCGNSAKNGGGASVATLADCTVRNNSVTESGGGIHNTTADRCSIYGNTSASNGGGSYGGTLNNCLLTDNASSASGGGASNGTLNNCTLYGNTAAGSCGGSSYATLNNCIVWGNTASLRPAHYGAICRHSCLDGALFETDDGGGNIFDDPLFVDAASGDFRLLDGSPCIDAGTNGLAAAGTDLGGNPRIVGIAVDMGAYEYQPVIGYEVWAAENGLGATDAVTDGQPNLVRYVFDRPSGTFSPFTGITFQDGNPVVWFQAFNPDVSDVRLRIGATTNLLDWTHAEWFTAPGPPFNFGGLICPFDDTAPARFFKLEVEPLW